MSCCEGKMSRATADMGHVVVGTTAEDGHLALLIREANEWADRLHRQAADLEHLADTLHGQPPPAPLVQASPAPMEPHSNRLTTLTDALGRVGLASERIGDVLDRLRLAI